MKKIAILLGVVVSAMAFVGCASQQPAVADKAAVAQPAPVKAKKDLKGESI